MKKKIIITSIASILSIVTLSTSIALYEKYGEPINIGISGSVTTDGQYTLVAGDVSEGNISPVNPFSASYTLGFDKEANSTYTQDTSVANISIEISVGEGEDLDSIFNALTIEAEIKGYQEGTFFADEFPKVESGKKRFEFERNLEGTAYIASSDVVFSIDPENSSQTLDLSIITSDENFVEIAEKSISYKITMTEPQNYSFAYLTGTMNSWASDNDYYRMVPDLTTEKFTWKYEGLEVSERTELKGVNGETWSKDPNNVIDNAGTYNITWSGSNLDQLQVTQIL